MKSYAAGFWSGFFVAVFCVVGCASTPQFPWRYFATAMPEHCYDQGILLGKAGSEGWPDEQLAQCKPDPDVSPSPGASPEPSPIKLKCITTKAPDFYEIKDDNLKTHGELDACQKALASCQSQCGGS